jgi:hypothetical protein
VGCAPGTLIRTMSDAPFVPSEFDPPGGLSNPRFVLEPLGPQHNDRDYWGSGRSHQATVLTTTATITQVAIPTRITQPRSRRVQ